MPRTDVLDYYVSLRRGDRTALLAGPFATHTEALAMVDRAVLVANLVDAWSSFDPYVTVSLPRSASNPIGKLNERLGIVPRSPC
jgi:hypothetical protein